MRLSVAPPAKRQAREKRAHRICLSPSGLYRQRGVWQTVVCVAAPERAREREDGGDWQRHLDSTWPAELLAANLDNACLFWQRHCGIPEVAVCSALQRTHVSGLLLTEAAEQTEPGRWTYGFKKNKKINQRLFCFSPNWANMEHGTFTYLHLVVSGEQNPFIRSLLHCY